MSLRSFFIVTLLSLFAFGFGWLLYHSSIAVLPALILAGFILFAFEQAFLRESTWLKWSEVRSLLRPLDFAFVLLGVLGTALVLPKMISSTMPLSLVVFMALVVFALIFLSAYLIFYEDR